MYVPVATNTHRIFLVPFFSLAAVEIHGHDKPILVGLVGEIYCSTYLNITQIEWFLVGVDLPKEKAYTQNVTLTIRGIIGLNGDIFKCRVTDVEGQQYEESVTIIVKGEFICLMIIHAQKIWKQEWADDISSETTVATSAFNKSVLLHASVTFRVNDESVNVHAVVRASDEFKVNKHEDQ